LFGRTHKKLQPPFLQVRPELLVFLAGILRIRSYRERKAQAERKASGGGKRGSENNIQTLPGD
jgi:hypothetical protein